ncbi:branched-chain amino acid ABC transporter permease [Rhodobacter sp. HX-7-19]|uniref:Branched-chain amino acid ABC transporter permease n=1 Tax=Paragemmobacter kunshanensis TaxID=2583234 RepID=A0A6M1TTY3_9RHOB|nr:AzlC family ABC transporter permease [Rhodobacter kunshanensis]NGQ89352.1 branched-chain amino acid ABC transporter permease [Rhodobacter kunshanensis]
MTSARHAFLRGLLAALPMTVVVGPFALLFGVVATEAGLNVIEAMLFSVSVFAGASQFAALQTMQENAPVLVVLATALAVNLRMVMYSVTLAPHFGELPLRSRALMAYFLVDQSFATTVAEIDRNPAMTAQEKRAVFFGAVVAVAPLWFLASLAGALIGRAIPPEYALDFALPITFLAMVAPMLRSLPHLAAAGVSILLSLVLAGLPYGTGLLIAAAGAMTVGALIDRWLEVRRA